MRKLLLMAIAAMSLLGAGADARAYHSHSHHNYGGSRSSDYYTAASGDRVHRPVRASQTPAGASARCSDGSYSFSESRRGTCSHHGGVARWL